MWGYYVLNIIIAVLVIIAVVQLLAALHAARQGDAKWKVFFPGARRGERKCYRRAVPEPPLVVSDVYDRSGIAQYRSSTGDRDGLLPARLFTAGTVSVITRGGLLIASG